MGICFVGEKRKFSEFICGCLLWTHGHQLMVYTAQYIPPHPGPIVNLRTLQTIGQHQGLWTYTIGQGAKIPGLPTRMYVSRKDTVTNTVYVVPGSLVHYSFDK